ncbi:hypothetical protein LguiA_022777 [Lonicera macranthoides]
MLMEMKKMREKKPKGMEVIKFCTKMKKMLTFHCKSSEQADSALAPRAIHCEELFTKSERKRSKRANDEDGNGDPFLACQIAAQSYFTMKPNIYI